MTQSSRPITVKQAATILHCDRKTVLRWIAAGRLPAVKLEGKTGAYVLTIEDVEALAGAK
jgi:excisionase family DNA binding protein